MNEHYDSVTPRHERLPFRVALAALLTALVASVLFGVSGSGAQTSTDTPSAPATDAPDDVQAIIDAQAEQIQVLTEQLAFARQAALHSEERLDSQRETILRFQEEGGLTDAERDDAFAEWVIGYTIGGGSSLDAFESIILPCESGGEPDPDAAVGPTDDWGRAQINRPTWSRRFTELTGVPFEEWIRDPMLNGYMAAVVEREQTNGLGAWTCWRRR